MAKKRKMIVYKAYMFKEFDPAMDQVVRALGGAKNKDIELAGGPRAATIQNWRNRKTRRPQHCTLAAALGAKGKRFIIEG